MVLIILFTMRRRWLFVGTRFLQFFNDLKNLSKEFVGSPVEGEEVDGLFKMLYSERFFLKDVHAKEVMTKTMLIVALGLRCLVLLARQMLTKCMASR